MGDFRDRRERRISKAKTKQIIPKGKLSEKEISDILNPVDVSKTETYSYKPCEHELHLIPYADDIILTGGGRDSLTFTGKRTLILDLDGNWSPVIKCFGFKLKKEFTTDLVIQIDWKDMGIPDMTKGDWQGIVSIAKQLKVPHIHVCCFGGHGRTGTALTILAALTNSIPKGKDPVLWLRDIYCEDAVETAGQIRYIERITGLKSKAKPSKSAAVVYSKYYQF